MRQNLIFLTRFLVGFWAVLCLTNWIAGSLNLRWKDVPNHSYLQVVHGFATSPNPVDVVFFGTSSMRNAIAPQVIAQNLEQELGRPTEVWNLAMPGATPEIARFYTRELFTHQRPRIFVLEAAPFLWDADRERHPDSEVFWRWFAGAESMLTEGNRMRRRDIPEAVHGLSWGVEALWLASGVVGEDFPEGAHHTAKYGGVYELEELPMARRQPPVTEQKAVRERLRVGGYHTSEAWAADLREIARLCQQNEVQLILVHQPFYTGLLEHFEEGAYPKYLQWIERSADQLGIPFYNLQQHWDLPMEHYRDFIHYAPRGAAWFSKRMATEILAPLLQQD
ncbi:MAG: hypothetical protein QM477_10550 [Planctomycetota bacterium]